MAKSNPFTFSKDELTGAMTCSYTIPADDVVEHEFSVSVQDYKQNYNGSIKATKQAMQSRIEYKVNAELARRDVLRKLRKQLKILWQQSKVFAIIYIDKINKKYLILSPVPYERLKTEYEVAH